MRTWIYDNLCYLTINCGTGQHSQFLQCFHSGFFLQNSLLCPTSEALVCTQFSFKKLIIQLSSSTIFSKHGQKSCHKSILLKSVFANSPALQMSLNSQQSNVILRSDIHFRKQKKESLASPLSDTPSQYGTHRFSPAQFTTLSIHDRYLNVIGFQKGIRKIHYKCLHLNILLSVMAWG